MNYDTVTFTFDELQTMLDLIRADEREECAKVADQWDTEVTDKVAEAIRERGEK